MTGGNNAQLEALRAQAEKFFEKYVQQFLSTFDPQEREKLLKQCIQDIKSSQEILDQFAAFVTTIALGKGLASQYALCMLSIIEKIEDDGYLPNLSKKLFEYFKDDEKRAMVLLSSLFQSVELDLKAFMLQQQQQQTQMQAN